MRRSARKAREIADQAQRETERLLKAGRPNEARNAAAAGGIWFDKAVKAEQAIAETEAHDARLASGQAEVIVKVLVEAFAACGVPRTTAGGRVMRELLVQAGSGAELVVSQDAAEEARDEVRAHFAELARLEVEDELRRAAAGESVAPSESASSSQPPLEELGDGDVAEMVVDAPLADSESQYEDSAPPIYLAGYKDERLARQAWEHTKAQERAQEAKREAASRDFGVGRRPSSDFGIFSGNSRMSNPPGAN